MWFLFGFLTISICVTFEFWRRHVSRWHAEGVLSGMDYRHTYLKGEVKTLLLGVHCHSAASFSLKRQSPVDNFFKSIGLVKEFETDDKDFDDLIYLISDNKTLHYALANSVEFRFAVKNIMNYGIASMLEATHIHCRNGRLWVRFRAGANYSDNQIKHVAEVLSKEFATLKKFVEEVSLISSPRWRDPFVIKASILLALSSGLAINGALQMFRASAGYMPFTVDYSLIVHDGIKYGLIILALFIAGAFFWLGKSVRTHIVLIELLTVGAFGIVATTIVELRDINMEMDHSQPQYFETQIIEKYTYKVGRRSNYSFYIIFKDWNCDCGNYKLRASSNLYNYLPGSGGVVLTQHQGRLGYPWVSNISTR